MYFNLFINLLLIIKINDDRRILMMVYGVEWRMSYYFVEIERE